MTNEQAFKIGRVLANAVTTYDRKQENRRGYNRYALPQYLAAVSRIEESLKYEGVTWQMAVAENFNNRLLTVCVKAIESHPELLSPELDCIGVDLAGGPDMTIYTCSKCGSLEQPCEHYEEPTDPEFDRINHGPFAHPTSAKEEL